MKLQLITKASVFACIILVAMIIVSPILISRSISAGASSGCSEREYIVGTVEAVCPEGRKESGGFASEALKEKTYDLSDDNVFYYDKRYAVIIVGYYGDEQHYNWFTNDAQRQYTVLTEKYGFNDSDIYVLLTLKEEWVDNLSVDPAIVDYDATEENIILVFDYLRAIIDEDDLLYVVTINHGGDDHHISLFGIQIDIWQGILAHDTYFGLEKTGNVCIEELNIEDDLGYYGNRSGIDNRVYDHELYDYTKDINSRRVIFVLQPCLSGGFINDLSKKNRVVITASRELQFAFAPLIGYFYHGLNGSADDSNNDGRLSLGEVYEYTADRVYQWIEDNPDGNMGQLQHPLIDDNRDKVGHRYGSYVGYDPSNKHKDGYVSARIYNLSYEDASLDNFSYEEINYPQNKPYAPFLQFLQNFLNSHPNLFPILQRLLLRLGLQ